MVKKLRKGEEENENLVFAIGHYTARDRSLEHELIEKRGGVAVHGSKGEEKKKKKETEVGGSPPLLVTLLYIAHFWLAYMRLFARTSTAKRSHPRTRDEGLSAERGWWPPCAGRYKTK